MTSQAIAEESFYRAALRAAHERAVRRMPTWIERLRESALDRFEQIGFPTTDEEDWKYTNVAPIGKATFSSLFEPPVAAIDADAIEDFAYPEAARSRLTFVNGVYHAELSNFDALPGGVVVANLADALVGEHEAIIREHLARTADYSADAFHALNTAFIDDGAFIYLPKGAHVESPLHLLFVSSDKGQNRAAFPRVLLVAARESSATIIESYESPDANVYFTNAVAEVSVGDGARITHYKVQRESERAFHIASTQAQLARSAVYDLTTITLGAQLSRHGIGVKLDHEGAECWVDGLYLVGTGQHADTHSRIDHVAPHCTSHQLYKGILDGRSRAVFNGKVFVHKDAQQTDAMQTNKNLLLSSEARVDTKPQLEIFADDVKCAHGATVGQLEEEELFYLKSRGLHPDIARNLLTYGFAEEVVEKIKVESIRAQLNEAILNRLHARLEA